MKIYFIRHGMTEGNIRKRYIGRTDEPLCGEGVERLKRMNYPFCDIVICSPMKRCIQTAEILFPKREVKVYDDFRECDFGDFEGKNYIELSDDSNYRKWIDSGGEMTFPNGENPIEFRKRCVYGFEKAVNEFSGSDSLAFVVHGGTIMSILAEYNAAHKDYYDFMAENGHGWLCEFVKEKLIVLEKL